MVNSRSLALTTLLICISSMTSAIYGQLALHFDYEHQLRKEHDIHLGAINGLNLGGGYAFQLPGVRIEFEPNLRFSLQKEKLSLEDKNEINISSHHMTYFSIGMQSNIYIFGIQADCDCPKIYDETTVFTRGFHLQLLGEYVKGYHDVKYTDNSEQKYDEQHFRIGGGIGFDFPIGSSAFLTPSVDFLLTPSQTFVRDGIQKKIQFSTLRIGIIGKFLFE